MLSCAFFDGAAFFGDLLPFPGVPMSVAVAPIVFGFI